jgi:hypothetical protein
MSVFFEGGLLRTSILQTAMVVFLAVISPLSRAEKSLSCLFAPRDIHAWNR